MKWHPDRNLGREKEAHVAFQDVHDAYAILSDAEQRRIYDKTFERETRRCQAERKADEEQEREGQRVALEHYEKMAAIAMRFADTGHNRDVIFEALLRETET